MNGRICAAEGCGNPLSDRNRLGLCRGCGAGQRMKARHSDPDWIKARDERWRVAMQDPSFRANQVRSMRLNRGLPASPAPKEPKPTRRDRAIATLDAAGQACLQRCMAGGISFKRAMEVARDEMRLVARMNGRAS